MNTKMRPVFYERGTPNIKRTRTCFVHENVKINELPLLIFPYVKVPFSSRKCKILSLTISPVHNHFDAVPFYAEQIAT